MLQLTAVARKAANQLDQVTLSVWRWITWIIPGLGDVRGH